MHTPTRSNRIFIWALGIFGIALMSGTTTFAGNGVAHPAIPNVGDAASFAQQNPEFAGLVRKVDSIYQGSQYWQDFFVACGGVGTPAFGCGLASDFYDQLANKYPLPKQEIMNPAPFRNNEAAQLEKYQDLLNHLKFKEKVCVSVGKKPFRIRKCITVSYPGSLGHYLDKVPDFPGTKKLKKEVRKAFDKAKGKYDSVQGTLTRAMDELQRTINELDQVQKAIDAENQKVERKAIALATQRLQEAIEPVLGPMLETVASAAGSYVLQLDPTYLRKQLDQVLARARTSPSSQNFEVIYEALRQRVDQEIQAGGDPIEVMAFDVPASMYHLMVTCVTRPSAEAVKTCVQKLLETEILSLSEDLVHSVYTHTSQRLLYGPCSSQLADDVTTEAAEETFGLSCAAYHTLQQDIAQLMQQAGNGIYSNQVAPFVKSAVRNQLRPSAAEMAKNAVEPVPLIDFAFANQNNPPKRISQCSSDQSRVRLADNNCIVPLQKTYIYDWLSAGATCALEYGAPLCTKDQVAEGQGNGYSFCAYSWTATPASQGKAYRVTPMAVDAQGCPPAGLNAAVFPISEKFSALCCVPMAP